MKMNFRPILLTFAVIGTAYAAPQFGDDGPLGGGGPTNQLARAIDIAQPTNGSITAPQQASGIASSDSQADKVTSAWSISLDTGGSQIVINSCDVDWQPHPQQAGWYLTDWWESVEYNPPSGSGYWHLTATLRRDDNSGPVQSGQREGGFSN